MTNNNDLLNGKVFKQDDNDQYMSTWYEDVLYQPICYVLFFT